MARDADINDFTVVERRDPLIGQVLDRRFQIEARLAAGGFGAIYRATHVSSGHEFAIKVLHSKLTSDPRVAARFRREGAALIRLRDPHTITAYELGEAEDGTLYIVMELLRGETLYDRCRVHGPIPWQRAMPIARAVCGSLAEAHALGIVHRDLKPTNIHLERQGDDEDFVKVLDFGIAKIMQSSDFDSTDLTHAGQMIGTLDYMSPEQMVGGECTGTSDIYTLGIVMYEMIAGRRPFADAADGAAALAAAIMTTPARLATLVLVPAEVDRMVMRCLARQSADRYRDAGELAGALDRILAAREDTTHPTQPVNRVSMSDNEATTINRPARVDNDATLIKPLDFDATMHKHDSAVGEDQTRLGTRAPRPVPQIFVPRPAPAPFGAQPPNIMVRGSYGSIDPADRPIITRPSQPPPVAFDPMQFPPGPAQMHPSHHAIPHVPNGPGYPPYPQGPPAQAPMLQQQPPAGYPIAASNIPPARSKTSPFDMDSVARRDTIVRRLVWLVLIAIGLAILISRV